METTLVLEVLGLTIVIELAMALILGYREISLLKAVVLVNCLTNPLLNMVILLNNYYLNINLGMWFMPMAELLIIITETLLLVKLTHKHLKPMFLLSLLANCASYLTGLILFH